MTNSKGRSRGKDGADKVDELGKVGAWIELSFEKLFGENRALSPMDIMLRHQFKRAWEGEPKAIRLMLKMLDANRREREKHEARHARHDFDWDAAPGPREPRNADMALLVLGICAVDDASLAKLGAPDDAGYEGKLKQLRPTRIEQWVVDLVLRRADGPLLDDWQRRGIEQRTVTADSPEVGEWRSRCGELISALMDVRGPGATRFRSGESGNPRGRPRKSQKETEAELPYGDFFIEPVETKVMGEKRTMTRLDALMVKLTTMAGQGDEKIGDLLLPQLMKHYEAKLSEPPLGEIVWS